MCFGTAVEEIVGDVPLLDNIARGTVPMNALSESRVGDSYGLGMLVLDMMGLGVDFLVFLEILWPLETLIADLAGMRFERDVDTEVRGDMVALRTSRIAILPNASEGEIVGRLASDVVIAKVIV